MTSAVAAFRLQLWRAGFMPLPLSGKRPAFDKWSLHVQTNSDEINLWDKLYPYAENTGILTRLTPTIDIDFLDEAVAKAIEDLARETFEERGYVLVRFGKAPKRAIPLRTDQPFKKLTTALIAPDGTTDAKVELLCDGQQVVVAGIHPDTKQAYSWFGGELGNIRWEELPYVSADGAVEFIEQTSQLLIKEFGYRPIETPKYNGGGVDGAGAEGADHHADWPGLVYKIINGIEIHDSLRDLAAAFAGANVDIGPAVRLLRSLMLSSIVPHDERWKDRFDDIGRAMQSARAKFTRVNKQSDVSPTVKIQAQQEFTKDFVPPNYLIDGILQRRFVYSMTGQTGHAKTAIALLIAEFVASGNGILGHHHVEPGRVLYFVGENPDDVRMRLIGAHSKREDDPANDQLFFIPGTFNIGQMFNILHADIDKIGPLDLIIVDTSAAYFLGQDENANPQIGAHARMLRALTTMPGGPTVLVLCHPIKHASEPEQLLPRGGGAFLAEVDGNLTVWKHYDDLIELHHNKMRGPGFEPIPFKLETIRTTDLVDAKKREIPTVRAKVISVADEDMQRSKTLDDDDRVMAQLLDTPGASVSTIAEACGWTFANGEPAKSRVQRALYRLEKKARPALVRKDRDQSLLTEEGKKVARLASLRLLREAESKRQTSLI